MAASRHECSICMDSFKNPKLISCHHSFCCKCLEDYVRANLHDGRFDCPLCRTSVELPKGGVSNFQTNFYIETDVTGNLLCDICGPNSLACRICLDCNENLCQSCCHVHERSKATRNHKICDLGTLDPEMKGKIRQRIFCDKHPEKDLELVCRHCNVLICYLCKAVNHDHHATVTISDAAADVKQTLQTKMNSCSEKLRFFTECQESGQSLDTKIHEAERNEIKALEEQRLQLIRIIDQEVGRMKDKIQSVYKVLRQQNEAFIRDIQDELKAFSNAKENAQKLIDQGSDINVIQKGPELEQLISTAESKTYLIPETPLERDLFSPADIKPSEIISMIGMMRESTKISTEERERPLRDEREKLERENREKAITEEREKKERDEREKKEREEKQIKEQTHRMEARVKALEDELSATRKQHGEAIADSIAKGLKLTQAEKDIQTLRKQYAEAVAQVEKAKKEREEEQIQAYRKRWPSDSDENLKSLGENLKSLMCPRCQGWTIGWNFGYRCKCVGNK